MAPTVADYLLERLRGWDVEHVFAYAGDGINGILAAWGRAENKPQFIQARHEEMAAFEAVGYGQPDRVPLRGGFQAGQQVAEPLGAGDPGSVHERGGRTGSSAQSRSQVARSRSCLAGAARSRRPATGSAEW